MAGMPCRGSAVLRASEQIVVVGCFGSCLEPLVKLREFVVSISYKSHMPQRLQEQTLLGALLARNKWRLAAVIDINYLSPAEIAAANAETQMSDGEQAEIEQAETEVGSPARSATGFSEDGPSQEF